MYAVCAVDLTCCVSCCFPNVLKVRQLLPWTRNHLCPSAKMRELVCCCLGVCSDSSALCSSLWRHVRCFLCGVLYAAFALSIQVLQCHKMLCSAGCAVLVLELRGFCNCDLGLSFAIAGPIPFSLHVNVFTP